MIDNFPQLIGLGVCFGLFVGYLSLRLRNRFAPYRSVCWGILICGVGSVLVALAYSRWGKLLDPRIVVHGVESVGSHQIMYGVGLVVAVLAAAVSARAFGSPWRREFQRTLAECVMVTILVFNTNSIVMEKRDQQERKWMQAESYRRMELQHLELQFQGRTSASQQDLVKRHSELEMLVKARYFLDRNRDILLRDFALSRDCRIPIPREFRTKEELDRDLDYLRLSALGSWLLAASILPWFMRRVRVPDKLPLSMRRSMTNSDDLA